MINRKYSLMAIVLVSAACLVPQRWAEGQDHLYEAQQIVQSSSLFMNLTSDDIWRAAMALNFANGNLEAGHPVTIFLNIEGVRIAVKERRIPQHVNALTGKTLQELLVDAMANGARVIVCPFCLEQAGFHPLNLIPGVELGGRDVTIPALHESDKVVSY